MPLNTDNNPPVRIPVCGRSSSIEELYALMSTIRHFEFSLLEMFEKGVLAGTTHTCLGQETTAVGIISSIDKDKDIVFTNHRGHGHFLAYCGEIERLYLEIMGRPGGVCAGRGGSQQLQHNNFYSNGILGGTVPVATGMAFAEKLKRSQAVAVAFLGDGTLGEGVVYESFNMASLWSLPVLYVIDNNCFAQSTPCAMAVAGSILKRPEAFGIPVKEIEAADLRGILSLASESVDAIRSECRPRCISISSVRLGPHSKGDDSRSKEEVRKAWERDPFKTIRSTLDPSAADTIDKKTLSLVNTAKERALQGPVYEFK